MRRIVTNPCEARQALAEAALAALVLVLGLELWSATSMPITSGVVHHAAQTIFLVDVLVIKIMLAPVWSFEPW